MAKFHNYYVLCPLIDQKSFLGVTNDKESQTIIVTLARNVVNRYRLTDQKQIGGWTSKDHMTAAVIYDKEQNKYAGVFNNNTIKTWTQDADNLDKAKKFKFPLNILKLMQCTDHPAIIVFSNGNCASLPYALENCKSFEGKSLLKNTEEIVDSSCYTIEKTLHICYIVKNSKDVYKIIHCPLREELGDLLKTKLTRVDVKRTDVCVVGKLISNTEKLGVYVLWSDGKMTMYNLVNKSWNNIGNVPWISTTDSVSLAPLDKNHLILFGSHQDHDGAYLVSYNSALGIGTCKYPMKMYTEGARLYCFYNRIVLEASNHIGMLSYILEEKRNLSSLLGSHDITQEEVTEMAVWDKPKNPLYKTKTETELLIKSGLNERNMCSQVILPMLEQDDIQKLFSVLVGFKDVPESVLVLVLKYALKILNVKDVNVTNHEEFVKFCLSKKSKMNAPNLHRKFYNLIYIFKIRFSDALLVPHLRNGLTLDDALFLITFISYLLIDSNMAMDTVFESQLFDWCILLMDSFYQQYLMTSDEKVTCVLQNMTNVVVNLIDQLHVVNATMPLLNKLVLGKSTDDDVDSLSYTIELFSI